jgi:hypothetical protein
MMETGGCIFINPAIPSIFFTTGAMQVGPIGCQQSISNSVLTYTMEHPRRAKAIQVLLYHCNENYKATKLKFKFGFVFQRCNT